MRDYGIVYTCFWTDTVIQSLSNPAKLLALYLLTGPHTNMLGCFRLPPAYIGEDLKWSLEIVIAALDELAKHNFISRDVMSGWLIIHHFLKWNPLENPNQGRSAAKLFEQIPTDTLVHQRLVNTLLCYDKHLEQLFRNRLQTLAKELVSQKSDEFESYHGFQNGLPTVSKPLSTPEIISEKVEQPFGNSFETVCQPFRNQEQKQDQEQDPEQKENKCVARARPRSVASADILDTFEHWKVTMQHPNAKLDKQRYNIISKALQSNFSREQLRMAITGCSLTPYNMGQNDRGQRYDGLHVILRDAHQIERFIDHFHHPPMTNGSTKVVEHNQVIAAEWLSKQQIIPGEIEHD